ASSKDETGSARSTPARPAEDHTMRALTIARFTIHEAISRRLILAGIILSLAYLALFAIGFALLYGILLEEAASSSSPSDDSQIVPVFGSMLTLLGLYAVNFLSNFLALFLSVGAVSGEIDSGTLHAVLARPIRRWEFVLGRWLGYAGLMAGYVALMSTGLLLLARLIAGYETPEPGRAIALMALGALLLMTISLLGSTILSTLANGVVVFSLFGLAWLAGIIEVLGSALQNQAMIAIGIVVSLIVPSDAIWRGASYFIQSPALLSLAAAADAPTTPFAATTPPAPALVVWAVGYVLVCLLAAAATFARRDL
ncbi:MAG TPA: ABC transporter permease, partial [Dehalococcoidia bacterium]|nr:ABC transporter permease [Dehalococcoidia bacterium]